MRLLRQFAIAILGLLVFVFLLNLTPIMAQSVIQNRSYEGGFAMNNSMRDLKNPGLTMEKNPLANLSDPLANLSNPLANLTNPLQNLK